MTRLYFHKMQGAGNDFVVLDQLAHPLPAGFDFAHTAQKLCARHFGAGGDGLLTLEAPSSGALRAGAAVRMRMWNPDGTEDMCGNGLRCIVALAYRKKHVPTAEFTVETLAGLRKTAVLEHHLVRVAMGHPVFEPAGIPMQPPGPWAEAMNYDIEADGVLLENAVSLSTGSTHTVIFRESELTDDEFLYLSPLLEHHPWFPQRTSVMWAYLSAPNTLQLRIWERGVGETLACGTGACAAVVAAQRTGRCKGMVAVVSRGGVLQVGWQPGDEIFLTGPAQSVFEGVWAEEV